MPEKQIKKCDYCGTTGYMPTFAGGDTCCTFCLVKFASGTTASRRREHMLRQQIEVLETELKSVRALASKSSRE